jgi:hypothetical protein
VSPNPLFDDTFEPFGGEGKGEGNPYTGAARYVPRDCLWMYPGTLLVADYGIQLTVMQPSLLRGETEGLSPLSQYNPHGVWLRRAVRWIFLGGGILIVAALAVLAVAYRADLEYRFEVTGLAIAWLVSDIPRPSARRAGSSSRRSPAARNARASGP